MRVAITGGTGFIGSHLARALLAAGHEVVSISRHGPRADDPSEGRRGYTPLTLGLEDAAALTRAFAGCGAVAHCAGINREIGTQTYRRVHIEGTGRVIEAARAAGVGKLVFMSFVRARPRCGSPYHESKWEAEELVRGSGLAYTVLKAGMTYGRGDHMLDHLSHAFHTFPVFALVGYRQAVVRPVAVEDLTRVLVAALVGGRLSRQTVAVLGPEPLTLDEAVRRVQRVVGRRPLTFRMPVLFHRLLACVAERTMRVPLVVRAQVQMLVEGMATGLPGTDELPADLAPRAALTEERIRAGLPPPGGFGLADLRCAWWCGRA